MLRGEYTLKYNMATLSTVSTKTINNAHTEKVATVLVLAVGTSMFHLLNIKVTSSGLSRPLELEECVRGAKGGDR